MNALSLMFVLVSSYAPTREIGPQLDPQQEARVAVLGKQLRCAVCQGVAIADSPAPMAQAQLAKVRELVTEGKNDGEILAYFVQRYGEWVLLEPTKTGLNSVLWAGPLLLLLTGFIVIMMQRKTTKAQPAPPGDAFEDPLLAQVRADLEK